MSVINLVSSTNSHIRDLYINIRDNFALFDISLLNVMKIANVYIGLNVIGLKVNVNPNLFQVLKVNILTDFQLFLERSYESKNILRTYLSRTCFVIKKSSLLTYKTRKQQLCNNIIWYSFTLYKGRQA